MRKLSFIIPFAAALTVGCTKGDTANQGGATGPVKMKVGLDTVEIFSPDSNAGLRKARNAVGDSWRLPPGIIQQALKNACEKLPPPELPPEPLPSEPPTETSAPETVVIDDPVAESISIMVARRNAGNVAPQVDMEFLEGVDPAKALINLVEILKGLAIEAEEKLEDLPDACEPPPPPVDPPPVAEPPEPNLCSADEISDAKKEAKKVLDACKKKMSYVAIDINAPLPSEAELCGAEAEACEAEASDAYNKKLKELAGEDVVCGSLSMKRGRGCYGILTQPTKNCKCTPFIP